MVTRAATGDRYLLTVEPRPGVPEAPGGHFFFRLRYRGTVVELTLRDGLVPEEFLDVACKEGPTPAEVDRARQLKEEMAARLLSMRPEEVYDAARWGDPRARLGVEYSSGPRPSTAPLQRPETCRAKPCVGVREELVRPRFPIRCLLLRLAMPSRRSASRHFAHFHVLLSGRARTLTSS
jgi:hypothetical protein